MSNALKNPSKIQKVEEKEARQSELIKAVSSAVGRLAADTTALQNLGLVAHEVKQSHELDINKAILRRIMSKELGYSYRRTKKQPVQSNSTRCLILR